MFRFITTIILSLFFNNVWADCDVASKFNIDVVISPINYDYSKTSAQIRSIPNIHPDSDSQYILGAYIPVVSIGLNYKGMKEDTLGKTCNKVTAINVTLQLESTIYIAQEIQQFSCTLNRTLQHEKTHFNFEKDSIPAGVDYLKQNFEPIFSQKMYLPQEQYTQYIKGQLSILQQNVLNLIQNSAGQLHATIDNKANYQRESSLCSNIEHNMVDQSMLSSYR